MQCPYCKEEMKLGIIHSSHDINWMPNKAKIFGDAGFSKSIVELSYSSFLKGSTVEAYLCDHCKKVIIDYSSRSIDVSSPF